jgi:hypothetical protein
MLDQLLAVAHEWAITTAYENRFVIFRSVSHHIFETRAE